MTRDEDKLLHIDGPPDGEARTARSRLWERVSRLSTRAWLITITALLGFVLLIYWLWPSKKAAAEEEEAANVVVSVRVAQAERGTISAEVAALGTIFPREQATVSPNTALPKTSIWLSIRSAWSLRTSTGECSDSWKNQNPVAVTDSFDTSAGLRRG